MPVPDSFKEGLARGWKTYNGSRLDSDLTLEADVAIVGSGAGGGTTAEILSAAGLKVLLVMGMVGLAVRNRYLLVPRLKRSPEALSAIARATRMEILMGLAAAALVAWFGMLEP